MNNKIPFTKNSKIPFEYYAKSVMIATDNLKYWDSYVKESDKIEGPLEIDLKKIEDDMTREGFYRLQFIKRLKIQRNISIITSIVLLILLYFFK